jgi:hypothetical protein
MNLKDVILIPNHSRPEFLTLCLELLAKTPEYKNLYYIFVLDYGFRRELLLVINKFVEQHNISYEIMKIPHKGYRAGKQSYALISGYRRALELAKDYVFMVEDDIFVANTFFTKFYKLHQIDDPFVVVGSENHNTKVDSTEEGYYITQSMDYQSLGVCFRKGWLKFALNYFTDEYFINPAAYAQKVFPDSKLGAYFCEQDGMFRRIIEKHKLTTAFITPPTCYHAGYYGKARGVRETGTLQQKIDKIREVAFDPQVMKSRIGEFNDSTPINLTQNWDGTLCKYQL